MKALDHTFTTQIPQIYPAVAGNVHDFQNVSESSTDSSLFVCAVVSNS